MLHLKYSLTLLMVCSVLGVSAFQGPITGTVLDAATKEPLPFTNIAVAGHNRGTVSNNEGQFILDKEGIASNDTILFSHVGYKTLRNSVAELQGKKNIYLHPEAVLLSEVQISDRSLTAEEIIELVRVHYERNHPSTSQKQRIFFHKYEKVPFPEENKITLKKSNFVGLDEDLFDEIFQKLPNEFIEYQDALVDLYSKGEDHKLEPVKGISLEEGSHQTLFEEMKNKLGDFFTDIQKSTADEETYYKIRTGIIGMKAGQESQNDSIEDSYEDDSLYHVIKTEEVKNEILFLLRDYGDLESKNWEFINKSRKYNYSMDGVSIYNDEFVYKISFSPKRRGLFKGAMYISTTTYAILQLDFAFAEGKQSENFQLFGVGHSMNFKKAKVIFEKGKAGYFVRYIQAQQRETASIDRKFTLLKKEKGFLFNKTLNKIKLEADLFFDINGYWEILVLDRESINSQQFELVQQPPIMKFKTEYVYTPEMWNNRTVIAPGPKLKKYRVK